MEALKSMYILSWVPFLGLMKKSRFVMPRSGKRMRAARTAFLICAVSAGPDADDDVAPSAGGGIDVLGPLELEARCWTVDTTMRRMLIRNSRLTCIERSLIVIGQ